MSGCENSYLAVAPQHAARHGDTLLTTDAHACFATSHASFVLSLSTRHPSQFSDGSGIPQILTSLPRSQSDALDLSELFVPVPGEQCLDRPLRVSYRTGMPGVPLDITPTSSGMRHHIRGTHYADTAVSSLEVLLLRYISLDQWALRAAANAFWRLYWPVSRGGIVRFEGTSQPLDPGSLYLISPHTAFDSECTRPFSKWYLHFHAGGLPHACGPGIAKLTPTARMRGLLRVICPKQDPSNPVHDVGIHSLEVLELTLLTLEQGIPHFTVATQGDSRVRECIHYVNTHLREKITLARLSRLAGVSPRSLARMFITELGFSLVQHSFCKSPVCS